MAGNVSDMSIADFGGMPDADRRTQSRASSVERIALRVLGSFTDHQNDVPSKLPTLIFGYARAGFGRPQIRRDEMEGLRNGEAARRRGAQPGGRRTLYQFHRASGTGRAAARALRTTGRARESHGRDRLRVGSTGRAREDLLGEAGVDGAWRASGQRPAVAALAALRRTFAERDVVALDGAFAPELVAGLAVAAGRALDAGGVRRDLRIAATGGTARRYRIAARAALAAADPLIAHAYRSHEVRRVLESRRERIHAVPYEPRSSSPRGLEYPGDVHDWHWDDYSFALSGAASTCGGGGRASNWCATSRGQERPAGPGALASVPSRAFTRRRVPRICYAAPRDVASVCTAARGAAVRDMLCFVRCDG